MVIPDSFKRKLIHQETAKKKGEALSKKKDNRDRVKQDLALDISIKLILNMLLITKIEFQKILTRLINLAKVELKLLELTEASQSQVT